MALAVCLLFDRRSERAVRALWDRVEEQGVPSLGSHTHGQARAPRVLCGAAALGSSGGERCAGRSRRRRSGGPQLRRRRAVPARTDLAGRGGERGLRGAASSGSSRRSPPPAPSCTSTTGPGVWLPHCSLAPRATLAQLPLVVAAVMDVLPLRARLDRAALVNSATGEISPLAELP